MGRMSSIKPAIDRNLIMATAVPSNTCRIRPGFLPALRDVRGAQLPHFLDMMLCPQSRQSIVSSAVVKMPHSGVHPCLENSPRFTLLSSAPNSSTCMIIESPSMFVGNGRLLRDSGSLTNAPHRIALGIGTEEALDSQFPDAAHARCGDSEDRERK